MTKCWFQSTENCFSGCSWKKRRRESSNILWRLPRNCQTSWLQTSAFLSSETTNLLDCQDTSSFTNCSHISTSHVSKRKFIISFIRKCLFLSSTFHIFLSSTFLFPPFQEYIEKYLYEFLFLAGLLFGMLLKLLGGARLPNMQIRLRMVPVFKSHILNQHPSTSAVFVTSLL